MVEVVAKALFASSSSDSDDFEIFAQDADTEESDAPTDPELGRADYWTCIKCKNQKNNPMYRFCEKCYQVNKTITSTHLNHFSQSFNFNCTIHRLKSTNRLTEVKIKELIIKLFIFVVDTICVDKFLFFFAIFSTKTHYICFLYLRIKQFAFSFL